MIFDILALFQQILLIETYTFLYIIDPNLESQLQTTFKKMSSFQSKDFALNQAKVQTDTNHFNAESEVLEFNLQPKTQPKKIDLNAESEVNDFLPQPDQNDLNAGQEIVDFKPQPQVIDLNASMLQENPNILNSSISADLNDISITLEAIQLKKQPQSQAAPIVNQISQNAFSKKGARAAEAETIKRFQPTAQPDSELQEGRITPPRASIFVFGKKVSMIFRPISQYKNIDILVIPFCGLDFSFYAGNIVNNYSVDYRKKIAEKGDCFESGDAYFQTCQTRQNHFKRLVFIKLQKGKEQQSYIEGLRTMFEILKKKDATSLPRAKIVVPISQEIGEIDQLFDVVLTFLQTSEMKEVRKVYLTTETIDVFMTGYDAFLRMTEILTRDLMLSST